MINKKKLTGSLFVFYLLLIAFLCSLAFAEELSDIDGHWAEKEISQWVEKGLSTGYSDGSFKPNDYITRAEFMALVNRAYGFTEKIGTSFSDVNENDWFYDDVAKAVAAGYLTGYSDETVKPNNEISRQEVAVILSRLLKLLQASDKGALERFSDYSTIPAWSKEAVNSVVEKGYMGGYPDGNYGPANSTTRGETVTILARAIGELYNTPRTYGPEEGIQSISGNVTVNIADVKIQNTTIEGSLYLTAGIGDGNVVLNNVTVKGTTVISGGGENSIVLEDCSLNEVIIERKDGKVRVVAQGNTNIHRQIVKSGAIIDTSAITDEATGIVTIFIATDEEVELIGRFDSVIIEGEGAKVSLINATIEKMVITETAIGATVNVSDNSFINIMEINAPTTVTGQGKIETAFVNVNGCSFEKKPENLYLADGVAVDIIIDPIDPTVQPRGGGSGDGGSGPTQPSTISMDIINNQEMFIGKIIEINVSTDATSIIAISDNTEVLTVAVEGKKLVLTAKNPGTANITVTGSKSGYNDRIRTFTVVVKEPATPEVSISAINATNGTVTVVLSKIPTTEPRIADFTITRSVNGGQVVEVSATEISWNEDELEVNLTIPPVPRTAIKQSVVISAKYKDTDFVSADEFIVIALPDGTTISNVLEATFEVQEQE